MRSTGLAWLTSAWLLAAVLVGTAVAVAALPFAPVERTTATVDWPAPGQPVESTMLTLLPYRPLSLDLEVPCAAAAAAADGAVLFSTFPLDGVAGQGLVVQASAGRTKVVSEGLTTWFGEVPPTPGCALRVQVQGEQTQVRLDGAVVAQVRTEPPRVANLATSLPPDVRGMSVRLEADSRYQSSPSLLKQALLVLAGLGAALAVIALAVLDRDRPRPARPVRPAQGARWPQDLVVAAVLGLWLVIGPMMADDGYNVAVASGFADTGFVGNYYHWYNAPEAPFALVQQAFVPLVELSRAPVLLRVPPLLAGLTTWLLLSRVLLPRLGGSWRPAAVRWVAVPVLLAWWMPFNNSLRPEPWVAVAGTAVLALVVLAVERQRVLLLGAAGAVAALSLAAAPSGLMAAAPLLVLGPQVVALLRSGATRLWLVGAVALVPAGVVVGTVVFADQPLSAVLEATRVHQVIGPSVPWWQEILRYEFLFSLGEMGTSARRLVVLATLLCLVLAIALRRTLRERTDGLLLTAAGCFGVALVLLVLAPSKWTHHFGGTVGFAVLLVVGLVVHTPAALRQERAVLAVTGVTSGLAAGVVALGFAGPNAWWGYSSLGIDPVLPGVLASPLAWLVVGAVVVLGLATAARRLRPVTQSLAALPMTVVVMGLAVSVATMLVSHAQAARELSGGWSMASQNVGHLTDGDCGVGDHLQVQVPEALEALPELGAEIQTEPGAFVRDGGLLSGPASLPEDTPSWGTLGPRAGDANAVTGTLTTSWSAVPDLAPGQSLGTVVSGRAGGGNGVRLEFADRGAPGRVLASVPVGGELDGAYWQQAPAPVLDPVPGDLVRVVATDDTTGPGGWLAVSPPVVITPTVLRDIGLGRAVHIDWTLLFAFPCLPPVPISNGLAALPEFVLTAVPGDTAGDVYGLALDEEQGGAFAMARQASAPEVLPTRLPNASEEAILREQDLGTLSVWRYPYPPDLFRLTVGTETVSGWEWGYRYPVPSVPEPLDLPGPRLVDKGPGVPPQRDSRPGAQREAQERSLDVTRRGAPGS